MEWRFGVAEQEQNQPGEGVEAEQAEQQARGSEDAAPEGEELSPEQHIEQLQEEVAAAKDSALRAIAEGQNAQRRAEQEVEKARKFALESFAKELLPVVDNLERALEAAAGEDEATKAIAEGVELTLKSFLDALKKCHVEPVVPEGEPFDPNLHQAMSMVENSDVEPNTVIAVMMKGYTLNGRLLRPAMVMVSKAAAPAAE
jgi:molecular chaperone GrpE